MAGLRAKVIACLYKTRSVCPSLSLFLIHGYSFAQSLARGMFIPLDGHEPVSERRSRPPVRALRATGGRYAAANHCRSPTCDCQAAKPPTGNSEQAGCKRTDRAPLGVTERRRRQGKPLVLYLFVALAFRNVLQYRHFNFFLKFICDDLAPLCVNLMNFGPVTSEFNLAKGVQPVVSFFKINILDMTDFYQILEYGSYLIVD